MRLLVKEAVVSPDGLLIRLRLNGLNSLAAELQGEAAVEAGRDGRTVDIHVPIEFKIRGGKKEIILPPDAHTAADVGPRRPIVVALARAYKWQRMLDTGAVGSLDELADRYDLDRSYVGRITKLATLAPDSVDTLVGGQDGDGITLGKLKGSLPDRWDEQRRVLRLHPGQ